MTMKLFLGKHLTVLCGACLVLWYQMKMVLGFNYSDPIWTKVLDENVHHKVVAFYHIFTQAGGAYSSIVNEQIDVMRSSGLLGKLDAVYYTTSGNEGANYRITLPSEVDSTHTSKFQHISDWGEHGVEDETLGLLYRYCKAHPKTKVLYFHDKGSFHNIPANVLYRQHLNCFVLNPHCLEALEKHDFDTCGWRASPIPHPHYPGNFWWATCHHINRLIDPLSPYINQTFIDQTATINDCVGVKGRFFAETWVTSLPHFRPADCMNASLDTGYIFGYIRFPQGITSWYCPNREKRGDYGYQCDAATIYKYPHLFYDSISLMRSVGEQKCFISLDQDMIKRSMVWYGQPPTLYLEWMKRVSNLPVFTDGQAIRPLHSRQIYYYKKNCLYPIPNSQVFISLGLDFDNVTVIHDFKLGAYPQCESL